MQIILLSNNTLFNVYKNKFYNRDKLLHVLKNDVAYLELFSNNFILQYKNSLSTLDTWISFINAKKTNHSVFIIITQDPCIRKHIKEKFKDVVYITE